MTIQTLEESTTTVGGMRYHIIEMTSGKHLITVMHVRGTLNYVVVMTNNAMQRAYRTLGKQFNTTEQALANYKTPAIRAMIQHAADQAAVALG